MPQEEFRALYPAHQALLRMQIECEPFGPDYLVLMEARQALEKAARHFTGDPYVYGGSNRGQG